MGRPRKQQSSNGAALGFEATLWAAADKLRGHMDAAEYKQTVLGFLVQRRPGPTCAAW